MPGPVVVAAPLSTQPAWAPGKESTDKEQTMRRANVPKEPECVHAKHVRPPESEVSRLRAKSGDFALRSLSLTTFACTLWYFVLGSIEEK